MTVENRGTLSGDTEGFTQAKNEERREKKGGGRGEEKCWTRVSQN